MRWLLLAMACSAWVACAEQLYLGSSFSVGPDGVQVGAPGLGQKIEVTSGNGQITANFSLSRAFSSSAAPATPQVVQITPLPPSLSDSGSFFRGVGGPPPPPTSRRPIAEPDSSGLR